MQTEAPSQAAPADTPSEQTESSGEHTKKSEQGFCAQASITEQKRRRPGKIRFFQ